jgi:hypothetical protein
MKKLLTGIILFAILGYAFKEYESKEQKLLRHVVIFSFKSTSSPADIKKIEEAFRALPGKIKEIKDFMGTNILRTRRIYIASL